MIRSKKVLIYFLVIIIVADVLFSFAQFYNTPLDGDLAGGIVPAEDVKPVLNSPFGLDVFLKDTRYPNPNRFFSHASLYGYFSTVPFLLQKFVDPITSIYLSCALIKIFIHCCLIGLLAYCISGTKRIFSFDYLLSVVLITPLFQVNYFRMDLGIVDKSMTYTFFYALPALFLLIYFVPLCIHKYHSVDTSMNRIVKLLIISLAFVVCLSGPLNTGVVLIVSGLFLLKEWRSNYLISVNRDKNTRIFEAIWKIPRLYWWYILPVCLLSVYSLFLGRYNTVEAHKSIPLFEVYKKLPLGFYHLFIQNTGFQLLFFILLINAILIYKYYPSEKGLKILRLYKWIGVFSVFYILLLPIGGYRTWRPEVLRYDTIIPITICLIFAFGYSTLLLIQNSSRSLLLKYVPLLTGVLLIFTLFDKPNFEQNDCERNVLTKIYESNQTYSNIDCGCKVMSWSVRKTKIGVDINTKALKKWRVIEE